MGGGTEHRGSAIWQTCNFSVVYAQWRLRSGNVGSTRAAVGRAGSYHSVHSVFNCEPLYERQRGRLARPLQHVRPGRTNKKSTTHWEPCKSYGRFFAHLARVGVGGNACLSPSSPPWCRTVTLEQSRTAPAPHHPGSCSHHAPRTPQPR